MIEVDVGPAYAILNPLQADGEETKTRQNKLIKRDTASITLSCSYPGSQTCRMSAKTKHEPSQPEWEEHASEGWPSRDGISDVDRS